MGVTNEILTIEFDNEENLLRHYMSKILHSGLLEKHHSVTADPETRRDMEDTYTLVMVLSSVL